MAKKSKKSTGGKRRKRARVRDLSAAKSVKGGALTSGDERLRFHK